MATTDSHARNIGNDNGDNDDDYSVLSSALTVLASNRQLTAEEEQALQQLLQLNQDSLNRVLQRLPAGPQPQQPQAAQQQQQVAARIIIGAPDEVEVADGGSGVSSMRSMSTRDSHHAGGGGGPGDVGLAMMVPSGGGVGDQMPPPDTESDGTDSIFQVRFQDHFRGRGSPSDTVAGTIGSQSAPGTLGGFSAANDSASLPARQEDDEATRDTEESQDANP